MPVFPVNVDHALLYLVAAVINTPQAHLPICSAFIGRYLKGNTLLNLGRKRSCIPHPDVLFMMGKPPMKKALKHKKDENNLDWNKQGRS
jgi:hypothetical protein